MCSWVRPHHPQRQEACVPHPTSPVIVRHPEIGSMIVLDPGTDYDPKDPLVVDYPWAFAPRDTTPGLVESVAIEQATDAPGEKRRARR